MRHREAASLQILAWQIQDVAGVYAAVHHQSLYSLVQCILRIYPVYGFPAHLKLSAHLLDIPMDMNTPIFAISRSVGWAAHIIEEKFAEAAPKPALYRPKAVYVGKDCGPQGCEYKALDLRAD